MVVDNHHLSPGVLKVEFVAMLPEGIYPDGDERVAVPAALDVELVRTAAPCPSSFEVEVMLPYIKFRYEDLTDEERAELMRPAVEAAERAEEVMRVAEAAESERAKQEEARKGAEELRVSAEASRVEAEEARKAAEQGRVAAEEGRVTAEEGRVTAEEARVVAERERAEVFDGFRGELDGKADKPAVFEVEVTKTISSDWTGAFYECSVSPFPGETVRQGDVLHILLPSDGNSREGYRRVVICKTYYKRGIGRYSGFTTSPDEPAFVFLDVAMSSATLEVRTLASAGNLVELQNMVQSMEHDVEDKADRTELREGLAGKQDALSTTTDLRLTNDNILGLTDMAKKRLFVDLWNEACGKWGKYDPENAPDAEHPFYLNELWLTYEEAVAVYEAGAIDSIWVVLRYYGMAIQTNLPPRCASWAPSSATDLRFRVHSVVSASDIEVLNLATRQFDFSIQPEPPASVNVTSFAGPRLRRIIGAINCKRYTGAGSHLLFGSCPMLEDVSILELNANLNLSGCPRINAASLTYLVNRRYTRDGIAITVTLHPDVFARLTDEANADWHQVLLDAAEKNITFATT